MVNRYGLREDQRSWFKDILPGRGGGLQGRKAQDNRLLFEAVL